MRTELTKPARLKALVLFKRVMEDLNPEQFTASELHQEGAEGGTATIGVLCVDTDKCLASLITLGYIERLRRNVYGVTETGRAIDYGAEIEELAPSPKL